MARAATVTNAEARVWNNIKLAKTNTKVIPTEANARALHAESSILKAEARTLMKDRKAAAELDATDPIQSFD